MDEAASVFEGPLLLDRDRTLGNPCSTVSTLKYTLYCTAHWTQSAVAGWSWQGAWVTPCPRLYWPPTHFTPSFLYLYFFICIFVFGILVLYFWPRLPLLGAMILTKLFRNWKCSLLHLPPPKHHFCLGIYRSNTKVMLKFGFCLQYIILAFCFQVCSLPCSFVIKQNRKV